MVARGGVVLIRILIAGSVSRLWDDIDTTTRGMHRVSRSAAHSERKAAKVSEQPQRTIGARRSSLRSTMSRSSTVLRDAAVWGRRAARSLLPGRGRLDADTARDTAGAGAGAALAVAVSPGAPSMILVKYMSSFWGLARKEFTSLRSRAMSLSVNFCTRASSPMWAPRNNAATASRRSASLALMAGWAAAAGAGAAAAGFAVALAAGRDSAALGLLPSPDSAPLEAA